MYIICIPLSHQDGVLQLLIIFQLKFLIVLLLHVISLQQLLVEVLLIHALKLSFIEKNKYTMSWSVSVYPSKTSLYLIYLLLLILLEEELNEGRVHLELTEFESQQTL